MRTALLAGLLFLTGCATPEGQATLLNILQGAASGYQAGYNAESAEAGLASGFSAGAGFPTPKTSYDQRSGNYYTTTKDTDGNTIVNGRNDRTGSRWWTKIDPQGNMIGVDGDGYNWTYNSETSRYQNYGTGEICDGLGPDRRCW